MFKSYYCEKIEKTLHFLPDKIRFCCSCAEGPGVQLDSFDKINQSEIISAREKYINLLKKGIIPNECRGCIEYKERNVKQQIKDFFKKPEEPQITHIIIDHFKQCDCACVYCSQKVLYPETIQNYEILPLIKNLYLLDMLDISGNLKVEFQGGNISMLKEFEPLMKEFNFHNCKAFVFLMNGIKYIPLLETIGNTWQSHICISLDAGTKETFKKIKGVDAFDTVVENIKKLKEKSEAPISLKYIIIKGINDNLQEIKKFLETAKDIGDIKPVVLEIDYNNTLLSTGKLFHIPEHYYELFDFAEKYCNEHNLNYTVYPYTKSLLDKGYSV